MDIYRVSRRGLRGQRSKRSVRRRTSKRRTKRVSRRRNVKRVSRRQTKRRVSRRRNTKNVKKRSRRRTKRVSRSRRNRRVMRGGLKATYIETRKQYNTADKVINKIDRSKDGANSGVWDVDAEMAAELSERGFFVGDGAIYPDSSSLRGPGDAGGPDDFGLGVFAPAELSDPHQLMKFLESFNRGPGPGCAHPKECNVFLGYYIDVTRHNLFSLISPLMHYVSREERATLMKAVEKSREDRDKTWKNTEITAADGICGQNTQNVRNKILQNMYRAVGNSFEDLGIEENELNTLKDIFEWNEAALARDFKD